MEKELKYELLDRTDYQQLELELGTPRHEATQINAYLDTPDRLLQQRRIMARIRETAKAQRMTVKWGASHSDGYFQSQEEEADLQASSPEAALRSGEAVAILARLCPLLQVPELASLAILGRLQNHRKTYSVDNFVLELDHSRYADGHEDFELELETEHEEAAGLFLTRLFSRCPVRTRPQTLTKYERFLIHCPRPEGDAHARLP